MEEQTNKQNPKIVVTEITKLRLDNIGTKSDTYNTIITKLLDLNDKQITTN